VHTLRTVDDAAAIAGALDRGPRVVVVGAGFIGSEVAASARSRGLEVTVVEALPVPLVRAVGERMGTACAALHRDHGTDLRCGVGVRALEGRGRVERVVLSDGSALQADLVVVGIGVRPATGWLEGSGLAVDDGLLCGSTLRAAPGVFAAGDIVRWPNPTFDGPMRVEHWTNAAEQGAVAARNLLAGKGARPFDSVPYFWSDQYGVRIQLVGHPTGQEEEVRVCHGSVEERRFVALYRRGARLVAALGMNWPRLVMRYRMAIGQRITWEEALALAAGEEGRT
jgi:NADPH-dependent 2,4-dienoyl-CoA reductase/sulfur reductase-like enzyme